MKTKVAIVIPTLNGARDLPKLLKSLRGQKLPSVQLSLIISDNGSTDSTIEIVKKEYPSATIIQNHRNLGLAGGNNVGLQKAFENGAEAAIVLNQDTYADPSMVENLVKAFHRHPQSLLSPKIYFAPGHEFYADHYGEQEKGRVIWYAGGVFDWNNVLDSHRGVDQVDEGQFSQEVQTDFATGCCLLIPADLAKQTGGFDPKIFLYREDTDLAMRVKKLGGQVWYVPSAVLWHVNAGSSGVGSGLQDYFITRNRLLFGLRWAPLRAKFAVARESLKLLFFGRTWQKRGVIDFYLCRFGQGSYTI